MENSVRAMQKCDVRHKKSNVGWVKPQSGGPRNPGKLGPLHLTQPASCRCGSESVKKCHHNKCVYYNVLV